MTTQEQAYVEGFVKRASQYGFIYSEAISLLKQAAFEGPNLLAGGDVSLGIGGVSPAPAAPNPALLRTPAPTNTFKGNTQLELNGRSSPAPSPAPAPTQQGPSNAYLAKVMGSYNPNSRLDRAKADAIRQIYQPGMTANQIYTNKGYQAASQRR